MSIKTEGARRYWRGEGPGRNRATALEWLAAHRECMREVEEIQSNRQDADDRRRGL